MELKLRAWDVRAKQMHKVVQLIKVINKNEWLCYSYGNNYPIAEYKLMQFTGLKDKKGIEIYEGDIDNKGRVCEYFHNLGSFGFKNPKYAPITFIGQFTDGGNYVVGNIYENPELLTI